MPWTDKLHVATGRMKAWKDGFTLDNHVVEFFTDWYKRLMLLLLLLLLEVSSSLSPVEKVVIVFVRIFASAINDSGRGDTDCIGEYNSVHE
jgi:hypothetical protein